MKKVTWVALYVIVALSLTGCCCCCCSSGSNQSSQVVRNLRAGPVQRETQQVESKGVGQAVVNILFTGGNLSIEAADSDDLLDGEFAYNLDELKPVIEYQVEGEQGRLIVRQSDMTQIDRFSQEVRNEWLLRLSQKIPLDLTLDVGASDGELALGGLRLTNLDMTVGAADLQVSFDRPNLEPLDKMRVHSGAAQIELVNLGNANLKELTFDGGIGTYTFDFRGEWQRSANTQIKSGVSNIVLFIPKDVGVRVCPGKLERGSYDGLEEQDGCYVNEQYQDSDIVLDISLDVGLSTLEVK